MLLVLALPLRVASRDRRHRLGVLLRSFQLHLSTCKMGRARKSIAWNCLFVSIVGFAGVSALPQPEAGVRHHPANCSWLETLLGGFPNSTFSADQTGAGGAEVIASGFTAVAGPFSSIKATLKLG